MQSMHWLRFIIGLLACNALGERALALDCTQWVAFPLQSGLLTASRKINEVNSAYKDMPHYADFAQRLEKISNTLAKLHFRPKDKTLIESLAYETSSARDMFSLLSSNEAARWKLDVAMDYLKDKAPEQSYFSLLNAYNKTELALDTATEFTFGTGCTTNNNLLLLAATHLQGLARDLRKHSRKLVEQTRHIYKKDLREAHAAAISSALECPCPTQDLMEPVKYHKGMKNHLLKSMIPELIEDFAACCGMYFGGDHFMDTAMKPEPKAKAIAELEAMVGQPAKRAWLKEGCDTESTYTQLEQQAMEAYTGTCYSKINSALRGKNPALLKKCDAVVDLLEIALSNFPDYRGKVVRIVSPPADVLESLQPGKIIEDHAFMSTSRLENWDWNGAVKLHIVSKHGKNVEKMSSTPSEGEVLLRPGSRFKVTRRESAAMRTHIYLEEIDEQEPQVLKTIGSPASN